jgi:toxin YoeB
MSGPLIFTQDAWDDYLFWQRTDKPTLNRINKLLADMVRDPLSGLGKPEPLRNALAGYWSRRIDDEHRLVYAVEDHDIVVIQARFHY